MLIVDAEIAQVKTFPPGTSPDYNQNNPIWKLVRILEATTLLADREHYVAASLQHLFGLSSLALIGPSGDAWQIKDPRFQDTKEDFQKQNLYDFLLNGTELSRGYAHLGDDWTGSFLRIAYIPRPPLLRADGAFPGEFVQLYLKVGKDETAGGYLKVPYNPESARYEIELWSYPGNDLADRLGLRGKDAVQRGALLARPDLVHGDLKDFVGPPFDKARAAARSAGQGINMLDRVPNHTMHPVRPLRVELAWTDAAAANWDNAFGGNYIYEFSMSLRGWGSYFAIGDSQNPHGGVGGLEYRNLYSNYFGHEAQRRQELGGAWNPELGRDLSSWNFDADHNKPSAKQRESFFSVDYMDLHILRPAAVIGMHRHRDNQEVFLLLEGKGLMVMGDWEKNEQRERAVELRNMRPGDLSLVKPGQFHALINVQDENLLLFMFGGYD
jgi:mannose-6-phosphate isomerase-like protein (cupin superfamily)